jgi:hypothetical protein
MRFESQMDVSTPPLPGAATLIFRENAYSGEDLTTNEWSPATKSASSSSSSSDALSIGHREVEDKQFPARFISILRELA